MAEARCYHFPDNTHDDIIHGAGLTHGEIKLMYFFGLMGEEDIQRRGAPPSLAARYENLRLIGEGGMGIVYRGRDPRLGRTVALKLIKGDDPALWRRFIQRPGPRRASARERVPRVRGRQADGEPFIVMQFIDGEPLSACAAG